jgi:hypothetical protein
LGIVEQEKVVQIDQSQLIPYFAQNYLAAQRALDKADRASALKSYQQLIDIYRQMESADVEIIHRELAQIGRASCRERVFVHV